MSPDQPIQELVQTLLADVRGDTYWERRLSAISASQVTGSAIHLAIFVEPYLQYILHGQKTVESRFASRRFAPYRALNPGDVILLKRAGGPVVGICEASTVWFYELDPASWQMIRAEYTQALCAQDPQFWRDREAARFATLIRLQHVRSLSPLTYTKRDRRGWVVLQQAANYVQPILSFVGAEQ